MLDLLIKNGRYVMVNGEVLLDHGEHTGALPGQTLRGPLDHGQP